MNLLLRTSCLWALVVAGLVAVPGLSAQDDAAAPAPSADPISAAVDEATAPPPKPKTLQEIRSEKAAREAAKRSDELRVRLANTVWNDVDLDVGSPGQVWMLRPPKLVGKRIERAWFLNDEKGFNRVGSWEVKDGQLLLMAMNGSLVGRGTYDDDLQQITGKFIHADHHREYGKFQLLQESERRYRAIPMRREDVRRRR